MLTCLRVARAGSAPIDACGGLGGGGGGKNAKHTDAFEWEKYQKRLRERKRNRVEGLLALTCMHPSCCAYQLAAAPSSRHRPGERTKIIKTRAGVGAAVAAQLKQQQQQHDNHELVRWAQNPRHANTLMAFILVSRHCSAVMFLLARTRSLGQSAVHSSMNFFPWVEHTRSSGARACARVRVRVVCVFVHDILKKKVRRLALCSISARARRCSGTCPHGLSFWRVGCLLLSSERTN